MTSQYQTENEIEAVVRGFEACKTGKDGFPHSSHLTVAAWYLHHENLDQATERMRNGLFRFLDHHAVGRQKYHETLTVFWMRVVGQFMERLDPKLAVLEVVNRVTENFGNSRLPFEYFSADRLNSEEARKTWVDPDLRHL
jgi:hypothetical protein